MDLIPSPTKGERREAGREKAGLGRWLSQKRVYRASVGCPEPGDADLCEPPVIDKCWGPNSSPLEEQQLLLTTELSFQAPPTFLFVRFSFFRHTHSGAQAGLNPVAIQLPQLPKRWDFRYVPPGLGWGKEGDTRQSLNRRQELDH